MTGSRAWAEEASKRLAESEVSQRSLAEKIGVARSTLIAWLSGSVPPDPSALQTVAYELTWPLYEQIVILGWATAHELPLVGSRSLDNADRAVARGRLALAFEQLRKVLNDFYEPVHESPAVAMANAALTDPDQRWEARVFPRVGGLGYRFAEESAVEFCCLEEPLTREILHDLYPDVARTLKDYGAQADPVRERIACETSELRGRLSRHARAAHVNGTWYGSGGERWKSLARYAKVVEGHVWTQMFIPTADTVTPALDATDIEGDASTILVLGSTFSAAPKICVMLANALGWGATSTTGLATARWGRPEHLGGQREAHLAETLHEILAAPPTRTVVSLGRLDIITKNRTLLDQLRDSATVRTFIVEPGSTVREAWLEQQRDNNAWSGGEVSKLNHPETIAAAFEELHRELDGTTSAFVPFEIAEITPPSAELFLDPRIGDAIVRCAEGIRRALGIPARPGTVLDRYATRLAHDDLVPQP